MKTRGEERMEKLTVKKKMIQRYALVNANPQPMNIKKSGLRGG